MFGKKYTLIILAFFLTIQLFGQEIDLTIEQNPDIKNIPVNTIIVDFDNNKWIGTEKGLFKLADYDESTTVTKQEAIVAAIMGENERGWVCTYDGKVAMFDKDVSYSTSVSSNDMVTCLEVEGNNIWLGTNNGLYRMSLKSKKDNQTYTANNSKLPSSRINDLFVDNKQQIWIGTEEGLMTIKGGKWISHLKDVNISAIEEHQGAMVVAGDAGIWRFKNDIWEELSLPLEFTVSPIEAMCYDGNGSLWIASGILGRLDENWMPYIYSADDGFTSNHPTSLAVDQRNNVWVGTAGKGLFVVKQISEQPTQPIAFADKSADDEPKSGETAVKLESHNGILFSVPNESENTVKGIEKEETVQNVIVDSKSVINGRTVKPGRILKVTDKRIKIAVWNAQGSSDGDMISLYYNDKMLLKDYKLTKKRKVLTLKVEAEAKNDLVVFAHTQNDTAVKTVKVAMLHEDHPSKWVTLIADSTYCDQVQFKFK